MKILGLTGGIGMGKSTAANLLRDLGACIIDTDLLARELVAPGQPALAEIQTRFGHDVIGPNGELNRERVASLVFADPQARRDLEGILHPRIRDRWRAGVQEWRHPGPAERPAAAGVVVIPLLFETNAQGEFDATICVACSEVTQRERLKARNWSDAQIRQRIEAQWPIEKKMAASTYVAWNEGTLEVLTEQLRCVLGLARS